MIVLARGGDSDSIDWFAVVLVVLWFFVLGGVIARTFGVSIMGFPRGHRRALVASVFGGMAALALALHRYGAKEVREDWGEVFGLILLGGLWLIATMGLFPWMALSLRHDAMEARNPAALVSLLGGVIAILLTFAGGNIGEGPSYWNNVFSAALGTGGVLCLWLLLEICADVSTSIAEERDLASGMRLGGFLIAAGLILGRAVAGDWHSGTATVRDFARDGWMAVPLWALAVILERLLRPSRSTPFPSWRARGMLPALIYLALAFGWVCHLGTWEGFVK